jgi:hypothetical protein
LFKSDARGKATSIAVFANWGSTTIVTFLYPIIEVTNFILITNQKITLAASRKNKVRFKI